MSIRTEAKILELEAQNRAILERLEKLERQFEALPQAEPLIIPTPPRTPGWKVTRRP